MRTALAGAGTPARESTRGPKSCVKGDGAKATRAAFARLGQTATAVRRTQQRICLLAAFPKSVSCERECCDSSDQNKPPQRMHGRRDKLPSSVSANSFRCRASENLADLKLDR